MVARECRTEMSSTSCTKSTGVTDGIRTHDSRNHNPGLYQLSYGHPCQSVIVVSGQRPVKLRLACPARLERATYGLEGRCSIQLSYGQIRWLGGRGERIRTSDILLPKQALHRAELHPEARILTCFLIECSRRCVVHRPGPCAHQGVRPSLEPRARYPKV